MPPNQEPLVSVGMDSESAKMLGLYGGLGIGGGVFFGMLLGGIVFAIVLKVMMKK